MIVIFLGGPGSGKGTQAAKLADVLGAHHINTGQMIRDHIEWSTEIGVKAMPYIEAGHLIPSDLTNNMIEIEIQQFGKKDIILDGYPRNIEQAEFLDKICKKHNQSIGVIINLDAPAKTMYERALKRGKETGRKDDIPELIKQRIVDYYEISAPLKDHYGAHRWYYDIDANQTQRMVTAQILEKIWWYMPKPI